MSEHLEWELSALLDNELSGAEAAEAREHLDTCSRCRTELESLRETQVAIASAPPVAAPPDLRRWVHETVLPRRSRFAWPSWQAPRPWIWSGSFATAAVLIGVWFLSRPTAVAPGQIPLGPLIAAHTRAAGAPVTPHAILAASHYSSFVRDHAR